MGVDNSARVSARVSRSGASPRRCRLPVVCAKGGDHPAIYYFLRPMFQGPSRDEYNATLEDPFYEPSDRLLIRCGGQITAHVHLIHRTMQFGSLQIPVVGLGWLATAPECRCRGQGRHLLAAAERQMSRSGALVGLLRTAVPRFFRQTGWALCGRHCYSQGDTRAVRARLLDRGLLRKHRPRFKIRPWRLWEQDALVRICGQNLPGTYGPLQRTPAYWEWLIRRAAYDQIYVALDGPELLELGEISTHIVGYAVTKGAKILELAVAPNRRKAAAELLARVCGDAIEHNRHCVSLHASPTSSLHALFRQAGGERYYREDDKGEVYMARLLNPLKLLRLMCQEFYNRAEDAGLVLPLELGLAVDQKKYQIEVGPVGAKVLSQRLGRSYLRLNVADFTRLVLGQLDWNEAIADRRLEASTSVARRIGCALFPRLPFWRPPFDDLQA